MYSYIHIWNVGSHITLQDNKRLYKNCEIEVCDVKYPYMCSMLRIPFPKDIKPPCNFWLFLWIFMEKEWPWQLNSYNVSERFSKCNKLSTLPYLYDTAFPLNCLSLGVNHKNPFFLSKTFHWSSIEHHKINWRSSWEKNYRPNDPDKSAMQVLQFQIVSIFVLFTIR